MAPSTAGAASLPITYRHRPRDRAKVHLKVAFNWDTQPLYDVIAKIPGSTFPDEWIIRGNHHDALGERRRRSRQRHGAGARRGARARRAAEAGLAAEAHDRLRGLGRRGTGAARIDRVGRAARRRTARSCRRLHQHRRQRPRLPQHAAARIRSSGFINGVARDITDPETNISVWKRRQARTIARGTAGRTQGRARAGRPPDRRARLRIRLHAVPPARRHRVAQPRLRRGGRRRHLPLDLRRLLFLHAFPRHATSSTAARWRRRSAPR